MPATRNIDDYDKVLIVEGYSDLLFYAEMVEHIDRNKRIFIKEFGGKGNFQKDLKLLLISAFLESKTAIGVIVDANGNPAETRAKMEKLLSELTKQTVVNGQWTGGSPNSGLLVVPGGDQKGEIETLVWNSWANDPANASQKKCITDFIGCMGSAGKKAKSPDKGHIGALLAIASDEDPRLGPGARAKVFDLARLELEELRQFLSGF